METNVIVGKEAAAMTTTLNNVQEEVTMEANVTINPEAAAMTTTLNNVQEEVTMTNAKQDSTDSVQTNTGTIDNNVDETASTETSAAPADQDNLDAPLDNGDDVPATIAPVDTPEEQGSDSTINPEVVARLTDLLNKASKSAFYMSNEKRVSALEEALKIPVSDDASFRQFFIHSYNDLEIAVNKVARKNRTFPEDVTSTMVMTEAQRRYLAKHGKLAIVNEEYELQ